jgi:hypothetical protein
VSSEEEEFSDEGLEKKIETMDVEYDSISMLFNAR